jgi:hypothetical protein
MSETQIQNISGTYLSHETNNLSDISGTYISHTSTSLSLVANKYLAVNSEGTSVTFSDPPQGGGYSTFVGLSDTPSSLTANKYLAVNSEGTSVTFADPPQGGGSSTFVGLSDTPSSLTANKYLGVDPTGTSITLLDAPSGGGSGNGSSETLKGQVLEYFELPSDGLSTRTVRSGTYTAVAKPSEQVLANGDIWSTISGTDIAYTPPTGTKIVYYSCRLQLRQIADTRAAFNIEVSDGLGGYQIINPLNSAGDVIVGTSTYPATQADWEHPVSMIEIKGVIKIGSDYANGSTPQIVLGEFSEWTSSKTIRAVHSSESTTYDGSIFHYRGVVPVITITAVGDETVTSGGGSSGGSGVTNFLALQDTPGSYVANKYLAINTAGTGITFADAPSSSSSSGSSTTVTEDNQILETITSLSNGATITSIKGDSLTFTDVTAQLQLGTSAVDIPGSTVVYRPPDDTNVLEYTFKFYQDGFNAGSYQSGCYSVYVDDVALGQFTIKNIDRGSNANIMQITAVFKIGGGYANGSTPNATHGEFASWTTTKTIKVRGSTHTTSSSYITRLFKTHTGWGEPYQQSDSNDSNYRIQRPILKLVAIGPKTVTSGDNSINIANLNLDVSSTDSNVVVSSSQVSTTLTAYTKYSVHVTVPSTTASSQSLTVPLSAFKSGLDVSNFLTLDEASIDISTMLMFIDKSKISIQNDNIIISELPVTVGGILKIVISASL